MKKSDKEYYALKTLEKEKILAYDKINAVYRERDILDMVCDHPNIIHYEACFSDAQNLYFLMSFAQNGSLSSIIRKFKDTIPLETTKYLVAGIVLALEHLHNQDVAHRDLKPDNILLNKYFHVQVCDFGEAKVIEDIDYGLIQMEYLDRQFKKESIKSQADLDIVNFGDSGIDNEEI